MKTGLDRKISLLLMIIIISLMVLDIVVTVTVPVWLKTAFEKGYIAVIPVENTIYEYSEPSSNYPFLSVFLIFCGLSALFVLWQARSILYNIMKNNPFCISSSKALNRAALGGFLIAGAFLVKMFVSSSALTLLCLAVFFLFSMFMLVLAELFKKAAQIKEENELTI